MHRSQCIFMLLISCTNQKENEPKLEVLYFEAVSVVTLESNQMRLEEEYWIEQIKDPTQSRVVENWTAIDGVSTRYEFNVHSELNFDVLIFLQDQLDSEGVGTYDGIGLDWSYWEYNLIQADGIAVITHGQMNNGEIILSTVGYGMDGQAEWTLDEYLTPITSSEWSLAVEATD